MKHLKLFEDFLNELHKIEDDRLRRGQTKSFDYIWDDPTDPKSPSSGILLRNDLYKQEFKDIEAPPDTPDWIKRDYLKAKQGKRSNRIDQFKVTMNNLKFLKDTASKVDELRCEYCNKGPLVIYDINPGKITKDKINNKKYRLNKKFDESDGATCDHRVPQDLGGDKFKYSNLAVACFQCNHRKKNMSWESWLNLLANSEDPFKRKYGRDHL